METSLIVGALAMVIACGQSTPAEPEPEPEPERERLAEEVPNTAPRFPEWAEVRHGRPVAVGGAWGEGPVIAAHEDALVAVGEVRDGRFRPKKVFADG